MVHLAAPNAHLYVIVVEQLEHLKHAVYCSDSVDQGCPKFRASGRCGYNMLRSGASYLWVLSVLHFWRQEFGGGLLNFGKFCTPAEDIYRCDVILGTYRE